MTQEEYTAFRKLPKRLKDLIAIGELETEIVTVIETRKRMENESGLIDLSRLEHSQRQELDMINRKNDLVRMYLGLEVANNG